MGELRVSGTRRSLASAVLAVTLGATTVAAADRRPVTETDLLKFNWPADPQVSPDGSKVVFVRVHVNEDKDRYESALYLVPFDGAAPERAFTSGPSDASPRWSPDGKWIVFVRAVEKNDEMQKGQLYLMPSDGGEPRALTDLSQGASSPSWSPDGRTVAFVTRTRADELEKDKEAKEKKKSDVRVITRAEYRSNGGGYAEPGREDHVWLVDVPAVGAAPAAPRQLTSGPFAETSPAWSMDGKRVFFSSTRVAEPYYAPADNDLFSVPVSGGDPELAVTIDGAIGAYALSPDGRRVAFVGTLNADPVRSYDQPDLFVADLAPGSKPRNLTEGYDFDIGAGVSGDQHAPRGGRNGGVLWSRDGKSIMVRSTVHGAANLVRVDAGSAKVDALTEGDQEVITYAMSSDGKKIAVLVSSATHVGDVFTATVSKSLRLQRVTHVNDALFDGLDVSAPEAFWYASFDGTQVQGWILKPPGFDAARKYPMILQIHGGPHIPYGSSFTHEFLWMAARGYVVLYTNPRGSTSYGQKFGNLIQYHYPGDDHRDLMAAVDELVKRGYVDEKRLGITGGSGGGVLTNWAISHTDRFAAAVSQRSIADWSGFWYTADFDLFQPVWFRGAPWEEPDDFVGRSPITHVARVNTPLMLIEGESDLRTPPSNGGEMMFRALKYLKKPVVMVRFPGESHELSRSGKPSHRVERLQHMVAWFDLYLQDKATDAYDVK